MYELSQQELQAVSAGNYEDWQVIAISGVSAGLSVAVTTLKGFSSAAFFQAGKYFVACSIPAAIASTVIVGSFYVADWLFGGE